MTIEITLTHILSAFGAILALYSVLYSRFGVELRLTERISAVEVKVGIWMSLLQAQLPHLGLLVKQPHPEDQRMDELIDKFANRGTTVRELYELRNLLHTHLEKIMNAYEQEKREALEKAERTGEMLNLSGGANIVATSMLYAAVGAQIEEHAHLVHESEARKQRSWIRKLFRS